MKNELMTAGEMYALLKQVDRALGNPYQWEPDALNALEHWLSQTRKWTQEGIQSHEK
jgi:hypothetical protein